MLNCYTSRCLSYHKVFLFADNEDVIQYSPQRNDSDDDCNMNMPTSDCLDTTPFIQDQPLLEQINILRSYRMDLLKLEELAVVLRGEENIILKSEDILDFAEHNSWIHVDTMDFCLNALKSKFPQSNMALTPSNFSCKFYNIETQKAEWRNTRRDSTHVVFDEFYKVDITNKNHVLHPLLMMNHWMLLYFDHNKKICTIYDSLDKTASRRNDLRKHCLPVFLKKQQDLSNWTCKYSSKSVRQTDGR